MKYKISDEEYEALSDEAKALYKADGKGKFVLQVEGLDEFESAKIREFRDNNIKLTKALKDTQAAMEKYKDVDPEKYADLAAKAAKLAELEEKNQIDAGNLDEVLAKRTETMRVDYDRKIKGLGDQLAAEREGGTKYKAAYSRLKIDSALRAALAKAGAVRSDADKLLITEARELFDLDENDTIVGKEGHPDLYDAKGNAMDVEGWAKLQVTKRPYLFEAAQGGGAQGGGKGGRSTTQQGGKKVLTNPDPVSFGKNLEDIASGAVEVVTD